MGEMLLELENLKLEAVLYALSDPVRLYIVRNLAQRGELACYAAVAGLEIAKSTQSHHYRILREAGLIAQRKEGVCFISSLRRTEVDAKFPGLLDVILKNCLEVSAPAKSRVKKTLTTRHLMRPPLPQLRDYRIAGYFRISSSFLTMVLSP